MSTGSSGDAAASGPAGPPVTGSGTVPSVLETRYRRLLRLLPRGYRAVREEEMVATFLAAMRDADPENFDLTLKHGRPGDAEIRAIAALAVRARWGETVAPERFAVRRDGLRSALLMALTVQWTIAVAEVCWWGWSLAFPWVYSGTGFDARSALFGLPMGSWAWIEQWSVVAWLPTLPLVMFGGRTGARWAAWCVALPSIVGMWNAARVVIHADHLWPGYLATVLLDAAMVGGLLALGAARSEEATRRPVPYLMAAGAGVLALNVLPAFHFGGLVGPAAWSGPLTFVLTDVPALWCWAALIAALWTVARWLHHGPVAPSTLLALSVFAGGAMLNRFLAIVNTLPRLDVGFGAAWTAAIITQFVLAGAICIDSGVMAVRRLRNLPVRLYPA